MSSIRRVPLVVALGVFLSMTPLARAVSDTAPQPASVTLVAPQDTATTYHVRDQDGRIVTTDVPAMGSPHVLVSDPAQGTVLVTVMAIDGQTTQVTVQTHEGQRLVLHRLPGSLAGLRVGDQFTLYVAQRATQ